MNHKRKALRLAFLYPGIFLMLAAVFGAFASLSSKSVSVDVLENAIRGMTALTLLAISGAAIGFFKVKKLLFDLDTQTNASKA